MQSGNNIHVQQHKTNMINEEWNEKQNNAPFVAFYGMHAVMFVLPDVSIAGLQWFILIPRLNHTGLTGQLIPIPYPFVHRNKYLHMYGFGWLY